MHQNRHLLLIRHARTRVQPAVAPATWPLHDDAVPAIRELAGRLGAFNIAALVSSSEAKAFVTCNALGDQLSLTPRIVSGLHEHERGAVDFVADQSGFEQQLSRFFLRPDELVFGRETAREAQTRFAVAVDAVVREHPNGDVAIVAHGTVITLFVALHNGVDPLALWRQLSMPACVVLSLPEFRLEDVETIRA